MAGEFLGALTGGAIGSAVVRLVLDSDQYTKGLATAKGQATSSVSGMSKSFSAFKVAAGAALASAGVALAHFVGQSIDAAIESEQVLAKLRAAVGENTEAYEQQALALQDLTGYQDEAILSADTLLSRFDLTAEQVRSAIPVVLDYARAVGKDVPAAASSIGKALLGNARALKEVGIDYTRTGDRAQDFSDILGLLTAKVGGTAQAFGQTTAGQLEIAQARFDELKEEVGRQLLPVLTDLAQAASDLAPVLAPLLSESLGAVVEVSEPLVRSLTEMGAALENLSAKFGAGAGDGIGFGDVVHGLLVDFNPLRLAAEYTAGALNLFNEAIDDDEGQAAEFNDKLRVLSSQFENGTLTAEEFATQLNAVAEATDQGSVDAAYYTGMASRQAQAEAEISAETERMADKWDKAHFALRRFGNFSAKELRDYRESVTESIQSTFGSLESFDGKWRMSAQNLERQTRRMSEAWGEFNRDLKDLNQIKVGDNIKEFLLDQGPGAVHAFVSANKEGRAAIVENIRGINDAYQTSRDRVKKLTGDTELLTGALEGLDGKHVAVTFDVGVNVTGADLGTGVRGAIDEAIRRYFQQHSQTP